MERRLAAILAADVVGYSRLMAEDETLTFERLTQIRKETVQPEIDAHNGRVVKLMGDGLLAEFPSVVNAVECGLKIQAAVGAREAEIPDDRRIRLRIGVNLGDIIVDGADIYGDGVNLAARLEGLAAPGGICISATVHQNLGKQIGSLFADSGDRKVKNMERPVRVFRWPSDQALSGSTVQSLGSAGSQKTLIVPPIIHSGDADTEFLAESLRDGLLNSINKQSAIRVIREPNESDVQAAYILEGSVRGRGNRVRLTFRLVDTADKKQIWSERYDRQSGDVFELEDEVSGKVSAVVRVKLKLAQFERLRGSSDADLSVPDLLDKAAAFFNHGLGNNETIEATLKTALSRDPENSMAHAMLAFCLHREFDFSPIDPTLEEKAAIDELVQRAVKLQSNSYFAHFVASLVAQDLYGAFERSRRHAEAALQTNPELLPAQGMLAIAEIHIGDLDAGIASLTQAFDVDHQDPHRPRHQRELATAHFMAGDLEKSAEMIGLLVESEPGLDRNKLVYATILAAQGKTADACALIQGMRQRHPELSMARKRHSWIGEPDAAARFETFAAIALDPAH